MALPKVSVIIPTYKRAISLERTVLSVIQSTYENIEIIVVDDNNPGDDGRIQTERTMDSLMQLHSNILYIKHPENKNGSAARNTGIRHAKGKYIMFLDDDDEFLPEKISKQVGFMEMQDDDWGACYTSYIDKVDGKPASICRENKQGNLLIDELARNLFIHAGSNLMVRKFIVDEINGFDESFKRNQDVEFLVRILKKYKLGFVNYLGLVVNTHSKNYGIDYFELTKKYIEKFQDTIDELPDSAQRSIYTMIALQQIRHAIEKRKLRLANEIALQYSVKKIDVFLYLIHLTIRYITKRSYGFDLNKLHINR